MTTTNADTNAEQITFATLISGEQTRLVRLCCQLTGDRHAAEDLAQETLLVAWRQRHKITDPAGIAHWLTAIARNVCRHHVRTKRQDGLHLPLSDEPGSSTATATDGAVTDFDLDVELERSELIGLLDKAMDLLPVETRDLLIQHYLEGLPQAELGAQFGLTKGAVAVRLHRGKVALRQALLTDFREDAVAYGLVTPNETTWTETRLWCVRCGRCRLQGHFDHADNLLSLRCPQCSKRAAHEGIITYSQNADLAGIKTFKPAFSRILKWSHYFQFEQGGAGLVTCWCCGQRIPLRYGTPPWGTDGQEAIYDWCDRCQLGAEAHSWHSRAFCLPQIRRFWRDHPRLAEIPIRHLEIANGPAVLVGFESVTDSAEIEVAFSQQTFERIELP
ncbi:MAG: RNA polymerase sigma factor [Caldilineaceae bacterium]